MNDETYQRGCPAVNSLLLRKVQIGFGGSVPNRDVHFVANQLGVDLTGDRCLRVLSR